MSADSPWQIRHCLRHAISDFGAEMARKEWDLVHLRLHYNIKPTTYSKSGIYVVIIRNGALWIGEYVSECKTIDESINNQGRYKAAGAANKKSLKVDPTKR